MAYGSKKGVRKGKGKKGVQKGGNKAAPMKKGKGKGKSTATKKGKGKGKKGGKKGKGKGKKVAASADDLDKELEAYMGEEAAGKRLDDELDNYFAKDDE